MAIPLEAVARDKAIQQSISTLAGEAATRALPDLSTLPQQQAGGVIRAVTEGVVTTFGNTATLAAASSYDTMSLAAIDALILDNGAKGIPNSLDILNARAALMKQSGYVGKPIKTAVRVKATVEPIVGRSMQKFSQGQFVEAGGVLSDSIMRAISNIYRETIVTNAAADPRAQGYQRVAGPGACSFCLTVALNQYTSFDSGGGYHDNCGCSTVPIFSGMNPVRPSYYDTFEEQYKQGTIDAQSSDATEIFAAIRQATGRR